VETFLRVDPFDHAGTCPVMITFAGRISVASGGGIVSYKWIRNDGASAPVETLTFTGPGSQEVEITWYIGEAGMNYSGWQAIEVLDPQTLPRIAQNSKSNVNDPSGLLCFGDA